MYLSALSILPLLAAAQNSSYAVKTPPLDTPWTSEVDTNPWPQYPRPKLERSQWQTLNGVWGYERASGLDAPNSPPVNRQLAEEVLVPSCLESGLSGIQRDDERYAWFSTSFSVPDEWEDQNVLLSFGAVDYEATVFVNGQNVTFHRGGYYEFTVDVTEFLSEGDNELLVFVFDPTDGDDYIIPIGKQTLDPSHIFYTACSGIWQTVWLEAAPANYISSMYLDANMEGTVNATIYSSNGENTDVEITVRDRNSSDVVARGSGTANTPFTFDVDSPSLWTPDSPTLYDVSISMGGDDVSSYTGFRTIGSDIVNGVPRPMLNGEYMFLFSTLDQGYWPDGIYTPPTYEAMVYDLEVLKGLNFNSVRKHIKLEPSLYYTACDELGLLVIQDAVSLHVGPLPNPAQQAEFERELDLMVTQLRSYTSIAVWVIYNEGWGQLLDEPYPEFALVERVRQLDPSRIIDAVSGWEDHGAGDFSDNHHYSRPQCGLPTAEEPSGPYDPSRIAYQGEFGGIGQNTTIDHLWNDADAIATIPETYELLESNAAWNDRAGELLAELRAQVLDAACSMGTYTQTADVEGEVNGLLTYDRRVLRPVAEVWRQALTALYEAGVQRGGVAYVGGDALPEGTVGGGEQGAGGQRAPWVGGGAGFRGRVTG